MIGYTSWQQLFVYSYFTCLLSAHLFISLLFSCLFILLFSYIWLQFFLLLFYAHCLYARVSSLHTLTRSLSDDPGFARPDIGHFVSIVQVFVWSCASRGGRFSLWFWYSHLSYLSDISLVSIYQFQLLFQFLIHMISCVNAHMWYCSKHNSL